MWSPAAEKDVLGLFDDFLQQPLTMLQVGDFCLVVGQRPSKPKPFVAKGGASRVWHHHRTKLLFVELHHKINQSIRNYRKRKKDTEKERGQTWTCVLLLSSSDANCVPEHKGSHLVLVSLEILVGASFQLLSGTVRWRAADLYTINSRCSE